MRGVSDGCFTRFAVYLLPGCSAEGWAYLLPGLPSANNVFVIAAEEEGRGMPLLLLAMLNPAAWLLET